MSNKLMILGSDRKKMMEICRLKETCLKRIRGYDTEESGKIEVGTLLLGNGKIGVIADKVLSYF